MVSIYNATSTTEAHLIKGLLEQHGIEAHVTGHYLQGAMGELPAINLVQINVSDEDESVALKVIADYDAGLFEIREDDSTE